LAVLSIQPKHSASSTASLYGIRRFPVCFFGYMSQISFSRAWFFESQARHDFLPFT
jgi:hypothetical protein